MHTENRPIMPLSEDEMYSAVLRSDRAYDGRFFTGVLSTGVFCYPSCSCRKPRRENVRFLSSREEALNTGFRPCKRCMPDLERGRVGYEDDLVAKIVRLISQNLDDVTIDSLSHSVGLSRNYLQRIFSQRGGPTLGKYISQQRAAKAAEILRGEIGRAHV